MTSPLAPSSFPTLLPLAGIKLAAGAAGIRYPNRKDVMIALLPDGTVAAGVFTRSLTASAPVLWCKQVAEEGDARMLIVNSGNSNAFTGKAGIASVERTVGKAAELLHCATSEIYVASTGVIGEKLPDDKITAILPALIESAREDAWDEAARAIMTTDTYPKMATRSVMIAETRVTLNGIAKGSGMIAPDMATMLAFVFTDANISAPILQSLLSEANETTFNCITVDGDTSTSDTLLMFATGKAGNAMIRSSDDSMIRDFKQALHSLLHELALHIVKDGEGAEKLVTINVSGAESFSAARKIGMSIGNSPLVKTALAASDANWGRIVAAVGKAGEKADRDKLSIRIGGVSVAKNGEADPDYREAYITAHMQSRDIAVDVDVGVGSGKATVYTCDLTHRYIDINGSYRS